SCEHGGKNSVGAAEPARSGRASDAGNQDRRVDGFGSREADADGELGTAARSAAGDADRSPGSAAPDSRNHSRRQACAGSRSVSSQTVQFPAGQSPRCPELVYARLTTGGRLLDVARARPEPVEGDNW